MSRNKFPEETVEITLKSALQLFLEKGYEQTTILDIVNSMGGLTRGAFYYHFKSKEEVLNALGDKLFYENNPFIKVKQKSNLNGLEKLKYLFTDSLEISDQRKINNMSVKALESPTFLKRLIDDNRDILAPLYCQIILEGVQDGSIKTEYPKLLSELLPILTNFWTVPSIFPSTPKESIERLHYIKDITDKMGLPVLDDDIIALAIENAIKLKIE